MSQHLDTYMTASSGYSIANFPEREQQNLKNQLAQADEWCGNYLITKRHFFKKDMLRSFTLNIHCRIQKYIHKLINTKTYI